MSERAMPVDGYMRLPISEETISRLESGHYSSHEYPDGTRVILVPAEYYMTLEQTMPEEAFVSLFGEYDALLGVNAEGVENVEAGGGFIHPLDSGVAVIGYSEADPLTDREIEQALQRNPDVTITDEREEKST